MPTLANDGIHWSAHDLLCRNGQWSYGIGGRGVGKTYDAKVGRTKHFLKTGRQWIYLRRYETEFLDKAEFFQDILGEFPNHEFKVEGMRGYIREAEADPDAKNKRPWKCFCFFVALSTTVGKKSVPYPNVDYIVFDEFIIDKGFIRYMPNETKVFMEFYNTVDRFEDRVRCLFLANAVSIVNPYFVEFGIKPRHGTRFCSSMEGYHVCEMIESAAYVAKVKQSRFGRMIANTDYGRYAIGNEFTNDESQFIAPKTKASRFQYAIVFDGKTLGFWKDYKENRYYVSEKTPKDAIPFVLTKQDMTPDMMMVDRSSGLLKSLKGLFMLGGVYFSNANVMSTFFTVLDYLNIR